MENLILEGVFADVQAQVNRLHYPPQHRVKVTIADAVREETSAAPFRPTEFRNGVPLLPIREGAEPLTTEMVKRLQEELDDEEVFDANRLAGR